MTDWKKRKKLRKLCKKPMNGKIANRPDLYKIYVQCKCFGWLGDYHGMSLIDSCRMVVKPIKKNEDLPYWAYSVSRYYRYRKIKRRKHQEVLHNCVGYAHGRYNGLDSIRLPGRVSISPDWDDLD